MTSATSAGDVGTVVCTKCGAANDGDVAFCGDCGAYLEWEGERVQPEPRPQPPPEDVTASVPEPGKPGLVERVKAGFGLTEAPATDQSEPALATAPPSGQGAPPETSPAPAETGPAQAEPDGTPVRAVRPGKEAPKPVRKYTAPEERKPLPGETICRECGAGNAPSRKFCRRCGTDLADAVVVPPLPWYRRILQRPARSAPAAGTRPAARRRPAWIGSLLRLLVFVLVVVGAVRIAWPWLGGPVETVRDRLSGIAVVNPSGIVASSSADGHAPGLARDGATNTYWSPARPGDGKEEFVEAAFAAPFRLVAIQVFNGSSEQPQPYLSTGRAATILVTATHSDGSLESRTINLADVPGKQDFLLGIDDVAVVRLSLVSAFGATPQTRVALAEVAFFKRS